MRNTALAELYDYLDRDIICSLAEDVKTGYLTENNGRDGYEYIYFYDGSLCAAVKVDTGDIVTEDEELDRLFG